MRNNIATAILLPFLFFCVVADEENTKLHIEHIVTNIAIYRAILNRWTHRRQRWKARKTDQRSVQLRSPPEYTMSIYQSTSPHYNDYISA